MQVDVDAIRGNAIFFVVDPGARFAAHEGAARLVIALDGKIGDPDDHVVEHVFIGAQIDVFGPFPIVDDVFRSECPIFFAIDQGHEAFDEGSLRGIEIVEFVVAAIDFELFFLDSGSTPSASISFLKIALLFGKDFERLEEDRRFGAPFGDVFVFLLLRIGEVVGFGKNVIPLLIDIAPSARGSRSCTPPRARSLKRILKPMKCMPRMKKIP